MASARTQPCCGQGWAGAGLPRLVGAQGAGAGATRGEGCGGRRTGVRALRAGGRLQGRGGCRASEKQQSCQCQGEHAGGGSWGQGDSGSRDQTVGEEQPNLSPGASEEAAGETEDGVGGHGQRCLGRPSLGIRRGAVHGEIGQAQAARAPQLRS